MNFNEIQHIEDTFQVETYKKMPISIERGEGSWVWTSDGEKYLDLYGGHAVCATGHSHPHVVKAIEEQARKVLFYSNLVYSEVRARAAEKLVSIAPDALTKAFFCNSGTEANENAMRMARMATGREKIVTFTGGFHGRTADSISATLDGKYRIFLIFDEVQTGVGRTGSWFFAGSDHAGGVVPDIISLAKSLGSGVPVGACLVNDKVAANIKVNDLGTTFGGGMIAMAAVLATLEAIEQDGMIANARMIEQHLRNSLNGVRTVVSVKGKGCLLGIEFDGPCASIHSELLARKIITGTSSSPNVLRLLPPLGVSAKELNMLVEVLRHAESFPQWAETRA